jgi:branched-chain amino acid transport system ATP-binding protein
VLSVRDLNVAIGRADILRDVALGVEPGSVAALIGRNGAGKTTLMRSVMGLLPIQSGRIELDGRDLTGLPAHRRVRLGIGYMPEDRRLVPALTVEENVLVPAWAGRLDGVRARLEFIFGLMPEVAAFAARRALQLSGGQQKLVALARALICGTKVLLLDEPFEGVAPALAQRLAEVISDLKGSGLSVLLSESDYTHSADLVDQLYVIERGRVAAKATTSRHGANATRGAMP